MIVFITALIVGSATGQIHEEIGMFKTEQECKKAYVEVIETIKKDNEIVSYVITPCQKVNVIYKKAGKDT